jgi:hypothetical protein|tara:strand:- start:1976 stop:2209 length:234 start_codon:yes stop_codon:yes gene_type:complete
MNVIFFNNNKVKLTFNSNKRENIMKVRRQVSATARKKHLKVQHHKVNSRRQFFFNQASNEVENQVASQTSSAEIKIN